MGMKPHVGKGGWDVMPKLSIHPDGFISHPGAHPGCFHPSPPLRRPWGCTEP